MGREAETLAAEVQCDRARRKRIVDQAALAPPPQAKKVLFDLGAHHGAALRELKDHLKLDDTWEIHVFEPNPACQIKERLQSFDIPVQVHEKAVWIEDGTVKLQQQNHRIAQNRSPSDGRSDMDGCWSWLLLVTFVLLPIAILCGQEGRVKRRLRKATLRVPTCESCAHDDIQAIEYMPDTGTFRLAVHKNFAKEFSQLNRKESR